MRKFKCLSKGQFINDAYCLVPIRDEDKYAIMKWRNEQIYHLRQTKLLTEKEQEEYFKNVVAKLFGQDYPDQLLFSYLENDQCIGYGGLVHINWNDKNAEISFIVNTALEEKYFKKHWGMFLDLIEEVAFTELNLHKIYTYAFDLRPQLYAAIEAKGYQQEAVLKEHCLFNGKFKNVIIHSKITTSLKIRRMETKDKEITFEWANDEITRKNSFHSNKINFKTHNDWFDKKLCDPNAQYFIVEAGGKKAGIVRFDKDESNNVIVSIAIDRDQRGKGLGGEVLWMACDQYRQSNPIVIWAYIKKDNVASVKTFQKAGFHFYDKVKINGIDAVRYKLSNNGE